MTERTKAKQTSWITLTSISSRARVGYDYDHRENSCLTLRPNFTLWGGSSRGSSRAARFARGAAALRARQRLARKFGIMKFRYNEILASVHLTRCLRTLRARLQSRCLFRHLRWPRAARAKGSGYKSDSCMGTPGLIVVKTTNPDRRET